MKSFQSNCLGCFPIYVMCLPSSSGLCIRALIHASGLFVFGKPLDSCRIIVPRVLAPSPFLVSVFPAYSGGSTLVGWSAHLLSDFTRCPPSLPPCPPLLFPSPYTSWGWGGEDSDTDIPEIKILMLTKERIMLK